MPPPEPPPTRSPWVSIVLASVVGLFLFAALLLLTGGAAVAIAGAAIVGLLAFGFAAVHYLVWGWWLGRIIRREAEEDAESGEQNGDR
jgi:Kef-type K+ transport system membrane component KefB